jgi:hypothetical protein
MPTYLPKYRGIQLSEALAQSATYAPVTYAVLSAFELYHPTLSAPVRFVRNHESITAQLEATAPINPSTYVTFLAASVEPTPPEESDVAATPEVSLTISNVSGLVSEALKVARDSLEPWTLIERLYASNDLTGPARLPTMKLELDRVRVADTHVVLRASFGDPVNIAIPKLTFKVTEYPGLYAR